MWFYWPLVPVYLKQEPVVLVFFWVTLLKHHLTCNNKKIAASHGPIEYEMLPESGTKLLVHEVPTNQEDFNVPPQEIDTDTIDSLAQSMDGFYMLVDPSLKGLFIV